MNALEKLKEEIRIGIGASDIFNAAVRRTAHAAACQAVDQCAAEIRAEVLRETAAGAVMNETPMCPPPARPPVLESEEDFLAWLDEESSS